MRLLIVRLGAVGDIIHTLPVAAALRRRFPDATIDWAVDERYAELLDLAPDVDRPIVLASRSRPAVAAWLAFRRELQRGAYEIALDLQGLVKSAAVARMTGAHRIVGFAAPFLRERWARWCYDEAIHPGHPRHVIDRNLGILAAVGRRTQAPSRGRSRWRCRRRRWSTSCARDRSAGCPVRRPQPERGLGHQAVAARALRRRGGASARGARPAVRGRLGPG